MTERPVGTQHPCRWERMQPVLDGGIVASLEQARDAIRLQAGTARVIGAGTDVPSVAAASTGRAGQGRVVAIVSRGHVDLARSSVWIG